jgi:hypothetical protein
MLTYIHAPRIVRPKYSDPALSALGRTLTQSLPRGPIKPDHQSVKTLRPPRP